jgi:hypothetical protein
VPDIRVRADEAIFNFDRLADVAVVADACVAANVTVGADFTVIADDDISFDKHSGKNACAFSDLKRALDDCGR